MATLNNDFQLIGRGTAKQYGYATGYLELYAKLNSQSVENNNSNVTVEVRLVVSGGYIGNYQSTYWGIGGDLTASGDLGSGDYRSRTLGSATGNISHSADGTKSVSFTGSFNPTAWGTTLDVSGSADLPRIPRKANLTNAENFNDEGNPKITYSNPAGNSATTLQARIESVNGQTVYAAYRDVSKTGTSYTFSLTAAERNALRNATPTSNKMNVVFRLRTTIGTYSDSETLQREMTIINANPTFTNFTYKATPTTLTGSDQIIIVGYSNVEAIISSANKAVANKGANMTQNGAKYQFAITGNSTIDIAYSSSSEVSGTINKAASGSLTVYAIDSRKNSKAVSKTISGNNLKNYSNIYLNASASTLTRDQSGIGGNVTLHYEGTIWNESFGSVQNSVVSATYQYKKTTDSTYTQGTTSIIPTLSGNNLSFTGIIAGDGTGGVFDISSSYNIQITITDELSSYTINLILGSGTPNLAYADDGIAVMGDYDDNLDSGLQVYGNLYVNGVKINEYSETEKKIGTWINGKPLYKKVFTIPTTTISSQNTTVINFSISNITVVNYGGILHVATSNYSYPISGYRGLDYGVRQLSGGIQIIIGTSLSAEGSASGYLIVEYTKTTD